MKDGGRDLGRVKESLLTAPLTVVHQFPFRLSTDTVSQCINVLAFYKNVSSRWFFSCCIPFAIFSPQMLSSHSVPFEVSSQKSSAERKRAKCSSWNSLFCLLRAHLGAFRSVRLPKKFFIPTLHHGLGE